MNESHHDDIGYQIQKISHSIKLLQNDRLQSEGLSVSHVNVMFVLYEKDGVKQSYLQRELGIRGSSLSKLIDILIQKDLVYKKSVEHDARTKLIYLTNLGKERKSQLQHIRYDLESEVTHPLTKKEIDQMQKMLTKIKNHLEG
ncbi:MarR family winged helix-turn-helix transcriptional regulator [Jeotgalibacillus sp. JSM ZJ347]|uniref:MarR family winged helix-turn-helix transcriptional regulator n=1 Tax=Jeotgalibacillus sp. JSM ZJ347 TaxID=3342117 RepID=UPI0035A92E3C